MVLLEAAREHTSPVRLPPNSRYSNDDGVPGVGRRGSEPSSSLGDCDRAERRDWFGDSEAFCDRVCLDLCISLKNAAVERRQLFFCRTCRLQHAGDHHFITDLGGRTLNELPQQIFGDRL